MKNMRFIWVTLVLGSLAVSLTTCTGSLKLNGILVTPGNPTMFVGTTQQFSAIGYWNDQTTQDISSQVTWSSSDPTVATIDNNGLTTAITSGTTTITATSTIPNSFSTGPTLGTTVITVTSATISSIYVTPANRSIPVGLTQQFKASGAYSDGTTSDITKLVTWSSSPTSPTLVAIIDSNGLAAAITAGIATITASITTPLGTISGTTTLTVTPATLSSISVTAVNPPSVPVSIPVGHTQQFAASGAYSDGTSFDITTQVTWNSSSPSVATVDSSSGLATAVAAGPTTITATFGGISANAFLTVTAATLSSVSVTAVNPPSIPVSIPKGLTQQFAASGGYSDGTNFDITTLVTWSCLPTSPALVAVVDSDGLATAISAGTATITASFGGKSSPPTPLTVTSATLSSISVTPINPSIPVGLTQQFTASGTYSDGTSHDMTTLVIWTSSNTSVATVNRSGLATGVAVGTPTITATFGSIRGSTILTVQ